MMSPDPNSKIEIKCPGFEDLIVVFQSLENSRTETTRVWN